MKPENEGLEQVKRVGWAQLEATARQIAAKTKEPLFTPEHLNGPSPDQIRESYQILDEATRALDQLVSKGDPTFTIRGDPIMFLDCEVNANMTQAKIYWSLPLSLVDLPETVAEEVRKRMQAILQQRGHKIQSIVFSRLRFYYPPKLRFAPSKENALEHAMKEM